MRPFGTWFGRFAMAGVCLAVAGCGGGGDVPDPDSDRRAAPAEGPRRVVDKSAAPEAPAAEAEAKAEPTALASNAPVPEPEKPAETEKAAPALKGDSSGTDEMLRSATTPGAGETPGGSGSAPSAPGSAGGPAPGPSIGAPSAPGGSAGGPAPGPSLGAPSAPGGSAGGAAPGPSVGAPSSPGGSGSAGGYATAPVPETQPAPGGGRMNRMRPGMANGDQPAGPGMAPTAPVPGGGGPAGAGGFGAMPSPGMPGGGPGGYGGAGSDAGAALGANSFRTPQNAVASFLAALKSKNKDRLAQTTAKRAPTEAAEKHRKIFSEIVDQSISDEDLDEMAKAMEGFQVVQVLQAKSTRKIDVVVAKMSGKDRLQRTIVTRQEVEGWKVLDIEAMYDFKPGLPPMFMRGRGRGRR
jgi:hypothetical protein